MTEGKQYVMFNQLFRNKQNWEKTLIFVLTLFAIFFFLPGVSHAFSAPTGITNYVALNISNSQSTATPNPFQQMINVTSTSSGWTYINTNQTTAFGENVEFFYANGTIIPSWLEQYHSGYAIWWVKIGSIPASSTLTIYMGFANKTTNLFNNKTTGEAPQLSSTYAEYDDGANVFNNYWNFKGTSLPTGWTQVGTGYSINNGFEFQSPGTASDNNYIESTSTFSQGIITEAYVYPTNSGWIGFSQFGTYSSGGALFYYFPGQNGWTVYNGNELYYTGDDAENTYYIMSAITPGSGYAYLAVNYQTLVSSSSGYIANSNGNLYVGDNGSVGDNGGTGIMYWLRTRAYPPNGVMPSVTFGSVQSTVAITLYLNGVSNANATITYGTESNFTAERASSYISLYVNGTKVVSLTQGKATYLKTLAAGLYKITAATNTSGVSNQTYYEKINPVSGASSLSLTSLPANFTFNGTKMTITGSISTLGNQLSATFSVNSNTIGTTTTSLSYSNATANTYTATIFTAGNQNYTSASLTKVFKISKATRTPSATVNGKALGSYTIRDANLSLSGNISALNPLTVDFYDNGKLLGTSPQTIIYSFSTLGNNVIVFNTSGNQNYTAASITGTINLTTNRFVIQDTAQNSSEISTFNLTVSNSTASKSYKNIAYNTAILYSSLPQGTDTFNFSNTAYNWTAVSQSNSIFTTTNTTVTAKQWEWIYFSAKVTQTGLPLTSYTFNLSDTNTFKYTANVSSQVKLSLQSLYSGTATVTIIKTGYNTTTDKIAFTTLSPSANTYTIAVSEAALTIYVYDMNSKVAFKNATISIGNGSTEKTFANITLPFFETYTSIPLGNDTITVSKYPSSTWTTSNYYISISSHSAMNMSTYIFNKTYAVAETFQVQGPYGQLEPNAIVYLESSASPFDILQECKTLGNGQCQLEATVYTSYEYYAAIPFSDEISSLSPLYTASSGSGGICPTGVWCSYLTVTLLPISSIPNLNISYSPESSFLDANANVTYTVSFSTTQNDLSEVIDNYTAVVNGSVVYWHAYTFSSNPTKGSITFMQTAPNAPYGAEIIENVTIIQSTGTSNLQYIYYVQGESPTTINNPQITNAILGISGLGPVGLAIFFFIVFVGVTVLVWIISGGAVLPTMLIDDAIMGLFAYIGVFNYVIGSYGSYFGWGLFGVFALWTIAYQMTKIGGMG